MKPIRLILLSILFLTLCVAHKAVGADEALPSDAQKLVVQCDDAILKARRTLVAGLAKSMDKATKSGNLAAANAIKTKMDEIQKLIGDEGALLGGSGKPAAERAIGKWKVSKAGYGGLWDLAPRGAITNGEGMSGRWAIEGSQVTITWSNGVQEGFAVPAEGASETKGTAADGSALTLKR